MELIILLIAHFIGDFILQSREMGKKKSEDIKVIRDHVGIILVVFMSPVLMGIIPWWFPLANAAIHGIIDWYIWRLYKFGVRVRTDMRIGNIMSLWITEHDGQMKPSGFRYWEDEAFYTTIGLDQLLHAITIVGLFLLV